MLGRAVHDPAREHEVGQQVPVGRPCPASLGGRAAAATAPDGSDGDPSWFAEAMARERWVRDTTFFLSGQTVSLLGSSLVQYSILWYLTLETQSGVVLTLATAFGFLPQAVMSVFGGRVGRPPQSQAAAHRR